MLNLLVLSTALVACCHASDPEASSFHRPEYIASLVAGDYQRLLSADDIAWDRLLQEKAEREGRPAEEIQSEATRIAAQPGPHRKVRDRVYSHGTDASKSARTRTRDELVYGGQLISTYRHRRIFRRIYLYAFAETFDQACPSSLQRSEISGTLEQAESWASSFIKSVPAKLRQTKRALPGFAMITAIRDGRSDASLFVRRDWCGSQRVTIMMSAMQRLFVGSPRDESPSANQNDAGELNMHRQKSSPDGLPTSASGEPTVWPFDEAVGAVGPVDTKNLPGSCRLVETLTLCQWRLARLPHAK